MHEAVCASHASDLYIACDMPVPGKELGHFRSGTGLYHACNMSDTHSSMYVQKLFLACSRSVTYLQACNFPLHVRVVMLLSAGRTSNKRTSKPAI